MISWFNQCMYLSYQNLIAKKSKAKISDLIVTWPAVSCLNLSGSRSFPSCPLVGRPCPGSASRTAPHALSSGAGSANLTIHTISDKFILDIGSGARFRWPFSWIVFCGLIRWFRHTGFIRPFFRVWWIGRWVSCVRWRVRAFGWEGRRWRGKGDSTRGSMRSWFRGRCYPWKLLITDC